MATTTAERIFVDTNVLVYATQTTAPWHAEANQTLTALHNAGAELWISRQILREYLATLSRPQTFSAPLPMAVLVADAKRFETSLFKKNYSRPIPDAVSCPGPRLGKRCSLLFPHDGTQRLIHGIVCWKRRANVRLQQGQIGSRLVLFEVLSAHAAPELGKVVFRAHLDIFPLLLGFLHTDFPNHA